MSERITLPRGRDLVSLAEAVGSVGSLLPRVLRLLPDRSVCQGEIGIPGHFFYGPRSPLRAGRYLVLFWLNVRRGAWSPRLVFDAVRWDDDRVVDLGNDVTVLSRGATRSVVYPLWITVPNAGRVEFRAWSDINSGDFRLLGVDVHSLGTAAEPAEPNRRALFPLWRHLDLEAFVNTRPDDVELWLAFNSQTSGPAQFVLSDGHAPRVVVEVPDAAMAAAFSLADGRLLLSLSLPSEAAGELVGRCRATASIGDRTVDLGFIEIPQAQAARHPHPADRSGLPKGTAGNVASYDQPSPHAIEVIAAGGINAAGNDSEVVVVDLWLDFPLAPAELDGGAAGDSWLRLRQGSVRLPAGSLPALRLGCGPNGGRCTIRHRNCDLDVDLYAPEPGFLIIFPTHAEAVLRADWTPPVPGGVHSAFEHMFSRLKATRAPSRGVICQRASSGNLRWTPIVRQPEPPSKV